MFSIEKRKKEEKSPACCCGEKADAASCDNGNLVVKVLGSGCKSCHALLENTQVAVKEMGKENEIQIEYITDLKKMMSYGVMSMPALVIGEKIVSAGKALKPDEVRKLIEYGG